MKDLDIRAIEEALVSRPVPTHGTEQPAPRGRLVPSPWYEQEMERRRQRSMEGHRWLISVLPDDDRALRTRTTIYKVFCDDCRAETKVELGAAQVQDVFTSEEHLSHYLQAKAEGEHSGICPVRMTPREYQRQIQGTFSRIELPSITFEESIRNVRELQRNIVQGRQAFQEAGEAIGRMAASLSERPRWPGIIFGVDWASVRSGQAAQVSVGYEVTTEYNSDGVQFIPEEDDSDHIVQAAMYAARQHVEENIERALFPESAPGSLAQRAEGSGLSVEEYDRAEQNLLRDILSEEEDCARDGCQGPLGCVCDDFPDDEEDIEEHDRQLYLRTAKNYQLAGLAPKPPPPCIRVSGFSDPARNGVYRIVRIEDGNTITLSDSSGVALA